MKVLFLTNIPSPYRVDFFNELGKYCDLTVLFETNSARNRDVSWLNETIVGFRAVFMKGIRTGEAEALCPETIGFLSKKKYDVIVVGMYSSPTGMLAIEYMRWKKIPFVLSSDGGMIKADKGFKHWVKAHFIGSASAWLSTGNKTTEYLSYYGAKESKVYQYPFTSVLEKDILPKPVSQEDKNRLRKKLKMKEKKIVLSVGQFIYRKGYDVLLEKCKGLDHSIGVYIVGGKATNEYIQIKEKNNLTNVHFIDFIKKEKLKEYYCAADLFVLPTREDIWGLVINEAMSFALPIITTDRCVAGVEMINSKENGLIIPIDSEWGEHIEKMLASDNLNEMAMSCLSKASEYSIENMAKVHMDAFNRIGGGK